MSVRLYVEGGGGKDLNIRAREGFGKLIGKAGFEGRMPRVIPSGSRNEAFDKFQTAVADSGGMPMLLVDSEAPLGETADSWAHVGARDGWKKPANANDDQMQFMVACMETWLMADRGALSSFYGGCLQSTALMPPAGLEDRECHAVQEALVRATRGCGRDKEYAKGKQSFELLGQVNPDSLSTLAHFRSMVKALQKYA